MTRFRHSGNVIYVLFRTHTFIFAKLYHGCQKVHICTDKTLPLPSPLSLLTFPQHSLDLTASLSPNFVPNPSFPCRSKCGHQTPLMTPATPRHAHDAATRRHAPGHFHASPPDTAAANYMLLSTRKLCLQMTLMTHLATQLPRLQSFKKISQKQPLI